MKKALITNIFLPLFSLPILAAEQTVTLSVPGMTCAACPITVKTALNRVNGVKKVDVSYENREARITYEDAQTSVAALIKATSTAGYPSSIKQEEPDHE